MHPGRGGTEVLTDRIVRVSIALILLAATFAVLDSGSLLGGAAAAPPALKAVPSQPLRIYKRLHPYDTDLFTVWTRLHDLTVDFPIVKPSHMTAIGHVNVRHRGIPVNGKTEYAVGYALKLTLKYSGTKEGLGPVDQNPFPPVGTNVLGSITGDNINGVSDHYSLGSFEGYQLLTQPGWYRLEVWGVSHSDISPGTDGLIEVNPTIGETTYNQVIVRVEEAVRGAIVP